MRIGWTTLLVSTAALMGCGQADVPTAVGTNYFTPSISEVVASLVGGALTGSDPSASAALDLHVKIVDTTSKYPQGRNKLADTAQLCPLLATAAVGPACSQINSDVQLTYGNCEFGSSGATWSGIAQYSSTVTPSGGSLTPQPMTCGASPTLSDTTATTTRLYRQFVDGNQAASSAVRTASTGFALTIDNQSANLANYQGATITTLLNNGYGAEVDFTGNAAGNGAPRTQVTILERVYDASTAARFDYSVQGSVVIDDATVPGTRIIGGGLAPSGNQILTYNNQYQVNATSVLTNIQYNNTCCLPMTGTITTTFTAPTGSTSNIALNLNGHTEIMTFGPTCGVAMLQDTTGAPAYQVSLTHCL